MKKIYEEYAELKKQEKLIALALDAIKPMIIEDMKDQGHDKLPTNFGSFTIKTLPRWEYSPAVKKAEVKLAKLKEQEQATEVAKQTLIESLVFNAPKPSDK